MLANAELLFASGHNPAAREQNILPAGGGTQLSWWIDNATEAEGVALSSC